ncbi:MAG: efflux RND transporter permease subunit [Chlorobi bacterium]|nr:efflux RND transporter permease subunit [Chlorobiota bacterium]
MKLSRLAVDNYPFTLTVFILLTVFGTYAFFQMPRTENPSIYVPGGSIVVVYPGAGPEDLEQLVAIPLEESVNELDDIERIQTELRDGIAVISVEFSYNTDAKEKYNELVRKVNNTRSSLPEDIQRLDMIEWTSSDVAILQIAFYSDSASYREMDQKADALKKMIERTTGVKRVEIVASPREEIQILPDMAKMARMHLSADQLETIIRSNNANIPGGELTIDGNNYNLKTSGSYRNLDEIRNTVVQTYKGRVIYLRDVAEVKRAYEDMNYFARYDGHKAIFLTVMQKDHFNLFTLRKALGPVITSYRDHLPGNISMGVVFDQSVWVRHRIGGFINNLLQGIVLVGLVVLLALGFRSSMVVILAIPLSIIIGLGFVDLSGYGLQQISIGGLVVALGLLVDNSIVVVENINRFILMGHSSREASVRGTSQIAWPVVTATLTTLLAFIPIITMPDKAGDFIRSLPLTILVTLTVSLLIALTLTPLVTTWWFARTGRYREKRGNAAVRRFLNKMIEGPYHKTLQYAIHHKVLILIITGLVFLGSLGLFPLIGLSFFPPAETPEFMVRVQMPGGTAINETRKTVKWVERILDTTNRVDRYASNIGHGNPRIYYNLFPRNYARDFAEIYVHLTDYDRDHYVSTVESLRKVFSRYPFADVFIKEYEQGVPVQAPVMVYVYGKNMDRLKTIAGDVEKMISTAPGAINVENRVKHNRTDLWFNINRDKAMALGIPVAEIDKTIRTAVAGMVVSEFRDKSGRDYPVRIRMPRNGNLRLSDLDQVYVHSRSGAFVPLKQLVRVEFRSVPGVITRFNMQRSILITADVDKNHSLDDVMKPVLAKLTRYPFPMGYNYKVAGELENRNESFGGMLEAGIIAFIAIFAVLVLQFRSFKQPLIIFVAVPLAIIGSLWALFFAGLSFSFTAFVGLVSLIGIVVNNSIILVDYANVLQKEGKSITEAVMKAGMVRFTPIILTAFTTIGGLLPLTLRGGLIWAPLGWTMIGGLLVSTMLTLLVVPVLYTMLTDRLWIKEKVPGSRANLPASGDPGSVGYGEYS